MGFKWLFTDCIILFLWFFFFLPVSFSSQLNCGLQGKSTCGWRWGDRCKKAQWNGAVCGWPWGGTMRVEQGCQAVKSQRAKAGYVVNTRVWRYFCFWPVRKNNDKHAARCDPQARIKWAAVVFLVFTGGTEVNTKNTKELPWERGRNCKKHDKLARRDLQVFLMP